MAKVKFKNKAVTLDFNPGTLYRLAKSGYSVPDCFLKPDTTILSSVELLRICSKTELSSEEVADSISGFEPLMKAIQDLLEEEEEKEKNKPQEGTPAGKVS